MLDASRDPNRHLAGAALATALLGLSLLPDTHSLAWAYDSGQQPKCGDAATTSLVVQSMRKTIEANAMAPLDTVFAFTELAGAMTEEPAGQAAIKEIPRIKQTIGSSVKDAVDTVDFSFATIMAESFDRDIGRLRCSATIEARIPERIFQALEERADEEVKLALTGFAAMGRAQGILGQDPRRAQSRVLYDVQMTEDQRQVVVRVLDLQDAGDDGRNRMIEYLSDLFSIYAAQRAKELSDAPRDAPAPASESADLLQFEGLWRYADVSEGCQDEDGKYRVAIGRFDWNDAGGIEFGVAGDQRIAFYDESCVLSNGRQDGARLVFSSLCHGEEDESASGGGSEEMTVRPLDSDHIQVSFDREHWMELTRCAAGPETADEPTAEYDYRDSLGVGYRMTENEQGFALTSSNVTLHLGNNCDVFSSADGKGAWGWANGGVSVEFESKSIGFPRQESPFRDGRCPL